MRELQRPDQVYKRMPVNGCRSETAQRLVDGGDMEGSRFGMVGVGEKRTYSHFFLFFFFFFFFFGVGLSGASSSADGSES